MITAFARIVLAGYYGFGNAGDELILECVVDGLRKCDIEQISVLSADPGATRRDFSVDAVPRWSPLRVAWTLFRCDVLIFGGGGLLQDSTGPASLWYYLLLLWTARVFRPKIWIYAAGIGPVKSAFHRRLIARTLEAADRVTVRDAESERTLRSYGFRGEIRLGCDPVLGLRVGAPVPETPAAKRRVVLILRETRGDSGREPAFRAARELAAMPETELCLAGLHPALDDRLLQAVESHCRMYGRSQPRICRWRTSAELLGLLAGSDCVVTFRLHGAILAAVLGVPAVGVAADPKVFAFLRELLPSDGPARNVVELEHCSELPGIVGSIRSRRADWIAAQTEGLTRIRARLHEVDPSAVLPELLR